MRRIAWFSFLPGAGLLVSFFVLVQLWKLDGVSGRGWHPAHAPWASAVRIVGLGWLCNFVLPLRWGWRWLFAHRHISEVEASVMRDYAWLLVAVAGGMPLLAFTAAALRTRPRLARLARQWRAPLLVVTTGLLAGLGLVFLSTAAQEWLLHLFAAGWDAAISSLWFWFAMFGMGMVGLFGIGLNGRWIVCGCAAFAFLLVWLLCV